MAQRSYHPLLICVACLLPLILFYLSTPVSAQGQDLYIPMPDPEGETRIVRATGDLSPEEQELVLEAYGRATRIPLVGAVDPECFALQFREYIVEHGYNVQAPSNTIHPFSNSHAWAECVERDRLVAWARSRAIEMFTRKLSQLRPDLNNIRFHQFCLTRALASARSQSSGQTREHPCLKNIEANLQLTAEGDAVMQELQENPESILARYPAPLYPKALAGEVLLDLVRKSAHREAAVAYEQYVQCISDNYADAYSQGLDEGHSGLTVGSHLRDLFTEAALECDRNSPLN